MLCPAQVQLDNGHFWPRDEWIRVGGAQTFSCQEGFILHGSEERNCTITGEWTGSTPVCRVYGTSRWWKYHYFSSFYKSWKKKPWIIVSISSVLADDCDDPGTPPGAHSQRFSGHFFVGDRVTYRCQSGLELLGSAQRVCLENREWSGSPPRCQSKFTVFADFDILYWLITPVFKECRIYLLSGWFYGFSFILYLIFCAAAEWISSLWGLIS